MRIIQISGMYLTTPNASVYRNKKGDAYFNIFFGTNDGKHRVYKLMFYNRYFDPNKMNKIDYSRDDYALAPYIKNNKEIHSRDGELIYIITRDTSYNIKNNVLLFWEIPNARYTDVKYNVKGSAEIIYDEVFVL